MTILMDCHEPDSIRILLEQMTPVAVVPLNEMGFADYQWSAVDGHLIQVERKQIDEILSGMMKVEEQLTREMMKLEEFGPHGETILLYERTCHPQRLKGVQSLRKTAKGYSEGHDYPHVNYTQLQAWLYQLDKAGVSNYHTCDQVGTALTLGAWYNSSQDANHQTLKRYIKDHIIIKSRNPHIYNLMAIKGADIGEVKATALIERYGTFWYVINEPVEALAETYIGDKRLGSTVARKLLKAVGRLE